MADLTHDKQQSSSSHADRLNRHCYCITLDRKALNESLNKQFLNVENGVTAVPELTHLFSNTPVFVPKTEVTAMEQIVRAIESATELPRFRERVLSWAPEIASFDPGPLGVFMGYDFHLGPKGPQLIEINTNAGGAFLNVVLARAQHLCCGSFAQTVKTNQALDGFEDAVFTMFTQEWQRQRASSLPRCVAIVDDDPKTQFMFPEF